MKVNNYFPTRIFTDSLPQDQAAALNAQLLAAIYAERDQDKAGISRSNYAALGGWHSRTNIHKDATYAEMVKVILNYGAQVSMANRYDPNYALTIGTMWSIINPPGSANMAHIHPNCLWSGVYYVHTPENAGSISFTDPRTANLMTPPRYAEGEVRIPENRTKITITPVAGKIVIFPSWLYHSVAPNLSDKTGAEGERVIISFNLNQQRAAN